MRLPGHLFAGFSCPRAIRIPRAIEKHPGTPKPPAQRQRGRPKGRMPEDTMPTALITGITGQDGSHLAELLLPRGYKVCGMVRRSSTENFQRIEHLRDRIELHPAALLDQMSLTRLLEQVRPDEIYNLAALSFVPTSWQQPVRAAEFTGTGVTRLRG